MKIGQEKIREKRKMPLGLYETMDRSPRVSSGQRGSQKDRRPPRQYHNEGMCCSVPRRLNEQNCSQSVGWLTDGRTYGRTDPHIEMRGRI